MAVKKKRDSSEKLRRQSRVRLCVSRSLKHISAQVIDDRQSRTITSASSCEPEIAAEKRRKTEVAAAVGSLVGRRAIEKGVVEVVFDRHGFKFHGRVKALAEAARASGLKF
jgi:large subunit ribosomal protein L18